MNSLDALYNSLRGLEPTSPGSYLQDVHFELITATQTLRSLFDIPPRNPAEEREIKSGKAKIGDRTLVLNGAFISEVLFLAQHLDISELRVAELVDTIMCTDPNLIPEDRIEKAIALYHSRRETLVACLHLIVQGVFAEEVDDRPRILGEYARNQLFGDLVPLSEGRRGALGEKILEECKRVEATMKRVADAITNAKSRTDLQGGTLGRTALELRHNYLIQERYSLTFLLYLCAQSRLLTGIDIVKLISTLAENTSTSSETSPYILCTILKALDPHAPAPNPLFTDPVFIKLVSQQLNFGPQAPGAGAAAGREWKSPKSLPTKSLLQMKWALFGRAALAANVRPGNGFTEDSIEGSIKLAIENDAFTALLALVFLTESSQKSKFGRDPLSYAFALRSEMNENGLTASIGGRIRPEFRGFVLETVRDACLDLIGDAPTILRSVRIRQEDLLGASAHRPPHHVPSGTTSSSSNPQPRTDISIFFILLGTLYTLLPPDSALDFFTPLDPKQYSPREANLNIFLKWASDVSDWDMRRAMFEMIAGLCNGKNVAEMGYNLLAGGGQGAIPIAAPGIVGIGTLGGSVGGEGLAGSGGLSWKALFRTLDQLASRLPNPRSNSQHQHQTQQHQQRFPGSRPPPHAPAQAHGAPPSPQEIFLLSSFLSILRTIVSHAPRARLALHNLTSLRAISSIVTLIPCHIPLELKGVLFATLSEFCKAGAGVAGVEICKEVWSALEEIEVLGGEEYSGVNDARGGLFGGFGGIGGIGGAVQVKSGVSFELDDVEVPGKRYPSTYGFITLLNSLIHTPKSIPLSKRLLSYEPTHTVPDNLGAPRRPPGIGPYVKFVIHKVLLPTLNERNPREYADTAEKWMMIDECLCFLENCLASYPLDELLHLAETDMTIIRKVVAHPGFEVLHQLLTDSPLVNALLNYLHQGASFLESSSSSSNGASPSPEFEKTMLRVLRITHRTLEIQSIFIEVLTPLLSDIDTSTLLPPSSGPFISSSITGLDQRLVWSPDCVISIGLCITYGSEEELVLMGIRTLAILSASPSWTAMDQVNIVGSRRHVNRLAVALERNADSQLILNAFVRMLNEDVIGFVSEPDVQATTGAGAPIEDLYRPSLIEAIRWEILDLLLDNTSANRQGPNLGHLLLGFVENGNELILQDPREAGARISCLHIILNLLNRGVPRVSGALSKPTNAAPERDISPLYETNPALAEKCYRLIYQLCTQDLTRETTMRYLRTRENFFVRHLSAMPSPIPVPPSSEEGAMGQIHYSDQTQVSTSCETIVAFLRLRSWVVEAVAQEVHLLTRSGQVNRVQEILEILFGLSSDRSAEEEEEIDEYGMMGGFNPSTFDPGQSLTKIVELFYSFDFDWEESYEVTQVPIQFYSGINLLASIRTDYAGCELVDRDTLIQMLQEAKNQLQPQLTTDAQKTQLEIETSYILASCTIENHRREIQHAKGVGLDSWRRLLDICLAKCFDRLPHDRRESVLIDLLRALPPTIRSGALSAQATVSLSETIVSLMTKLRADRYQQVIVQSPVDDSYAATLPTENLLTLLKSILECILDNSQLELVRGNLYAALINFLNLVDSSRRQTPSSADSHASIARLNMSQTLDDVSSFNGDSSSLDLSFSQRPSKAPRSDLESGTLEVLSVVVEKLMQVVARDAIDGTEVWRSVALTFLDSLIRISRSEKSHPVLTTLAKQGALYTLVRGIKDIDADIEMLYDPDPMNLNSLYVYEARMALLTRIAQTRQGAERLVDSRLFPVLTQCEFIDAKPEADRNILDASSFLPNALHRYHQLLLPALQLIDSVLATLGSSSKQASKQAFDFLIAHRETITILLKDNSSEISLASFQDRQLLVSICSYVFPSIERTKLGPADFGPIHAAVANIGARCLVPSRWHQMPRPLNDAELVAQATTVDVGGRHVTKFDVMVQTSLKSLKYWVINYLSTSSNSMGLDFRRVLSASTAQKTDTTAHGLVLQPSIGDAIFALGSVFDQLTDVLRQVSNLSHKLANKESVDAMEVSNIVRSSGVLFIKDLQTPQQRSFAFREIERQRNEAAAEVLTFIHSLEVLLLLIWRHLDYFLSGRHLEEHLTQSDSSSGGPISLTASRVGNPRSVHHVDLGALRNEAAAQLIPIVEKSAKTLTRVNPSRISSAEKYEIRSR
ncbi:hypothetical protein SISSUDRAFT_665994 [Sistotremastrum suecicum HHB10207 ss-3]|uniref:Nucleoporin Nup186/Nup192/Nup205 n=1 Tax=Sistotremastrum suecicum HHB10207 ss-3 TaxID=1314776 RepID=A0A166E3P1_9AGAM|nr:hypothetical protein SISSUDRAFT_665994 [Sistotremastrum suecicum HHB10207 ss-3]